MLQIKNVKKSYKTGNFIQIALNNVNLNFISNIKDLFDNRNFK